MQASHLVLAVHKLHKQYGQFQVLKNLNLDVERSAIHGLVGLNGSGKTTTLECLLGLQQFDQGEISLLGFEPKNLHKAQGKVVAIFDTPSLHQHLTVRQTMEHAALLCPTAKRTPTEVETLLGIQKYSSFKISQLSLGNKRRASLAQAILGDPELILLDEPFNGLDAGGVQDVLALITSLNQEQGTTFLLSSHQLPYLEQICTHIAVLHQGAIAVNNEINALFDSDSLQLELQTENPALAIDEIEKLPGATLVNAADNNLLVDIGQHQPSFVNKTLVQAGVPISELKLKRASLESLFEQITKFGDRK